MRKALIAVAVATALFAVGAFAASFAVQSEDVASGANEVVKCATNVDVDFDDPELNTSTGAWTVDGATVKFLNSAGATVNTCNNHDARLAIDTGSFANVQALNADSPVDAGQAVFTFTAIDVAVIDGASVVVDGATFTASPVIP